MKKYGLIGYPLAHSFSQEYFTEKFKQEGLDNDHRYDLFPLQQLSEFPELLKDNPDLCGLNVTLPHKIGILFYLDKIDQAAREIDAVNCIRIVNNHPVESFFAGELSSLNVRLEGYNTDAYGFEKSIKPLLKKNHQKALILGNGGASRAVVYVLKRLDIDYTLVSRRNIKKQISYTQITPEVMKEHQIIINATPSGTFPNITECPDIPYEYITPRHLLYDMVYNPLRTEFLKRGNAQGATIKNGLEMLHLQAEKAWEIWNG